MNWGKIYGEKRRGEKCLMGKIVSGEKCRGENCLLGKNVTEPLIQYSEFTTENFCVRRAKEIQLKFLTNAY